MKRARTRGFTLLEVLLATAIMAVGTTSVLVVIATAAGMASQRQVNVRREQVMDEARHDAQAMVDAFRPAKPVVAPAPVPGARKPAKGAESQPDLAPPDVEGKRSSRYDGFTYDIQFTPKDRRVPEKGFDVDITLHYGGGELSVSSQTSMIATTIAPDEFLTSTTHEEERLGLANRDKPREKR